MERELLIPSKPDAIEKVENFLTSLARDLGLDEDLTGDLIIAGTEAANNAIYHGNQLNSSLQVRLLARLEVLQQGGKLLLSISDMGQDGFTGDQGESELPESLLAESGRGLMIIRHLMDEVHVNSDQAGTHVTIVKRLASLPAA